MALVGAVDVGLVLRDDGQKSFLFIFMAWNLRRPQKLGLESKFQAVM